MSGTSMAARWCPDAATMIYSYFDGIRVADVKEILMSTVTPMESLNEVTVSGGRLNVGAALSYDISRLSRKGISDRWNETGERNGSISGDADLEPEWRNVSDCPRPSILMGILISFSMQRENTRQGSLRTDCGRNGVYG